MRILALDPGLTSGLACWNGEKFKSWQKPTWDAMDDLYRFAWDVTVLEDQLVVCESFVPRPGVRTWQPDALESIGAARYLCRRSPRTAFELQTPAEAKRFATNDKLKLLGWKNATPGGHADDAARHLLVAAVKRGLIDPARFTVH